MKLSALHNPGRPVALDLAGLELLAFSISGVSTYVLVPQFGCCFDLGHCAFEAAGLRTVFLSHVHQDHAGGAHRHRSLRAMTSQAPSQIYCPTESVGALRELFRAYARLEEKAPDEDLDTAVCGLAPGDRVNLGTRAWVEVFDVSHRIASRGFTLVERRRKLRPEFAGRSGEEIGAAVRAGENVHDETHHRRLTYIGDSTIETFEKNPGIADCDVLFVEATHILDTPVAASWRYGHTHLDELVALWERTPSALAARHLVIKHFSVKYRQDDLHRAYDRLPAGLRERVTFLI